MRNLDTGKLYSNGFFAFLCGIVLLGTLLGTVSFCSTDGELLTRLGIAQENFIRLRREMDFAQILVSSLSGTTIFLAAAFVCGLCAVGQPIELLVLLTRGMGLGMTLSQLYYGFGKGKLLFCAGLYLPGAVVSTAVLIFAVREAAAMSTIYLRLTASDRQEEGLRQSIKLYGTKFLVLETILAAAAAIDCLCNYLFIFRL